MVKSREDKECLLPHHWSHREREAQFSLQFTLELYYPDLHKLKLKMTLQIFGSHRLPFAAGKIKF